MLDGLELFEWDQMEDVYGTAERVPELLWAIVRNETLENDRSPVSVLYSTLCHQGVVNEASGYAVPFLLELIASEGIPGPIRGVLLELLYDIYHGSSYLETHRKLEDSEDPDFAELREREKEWVRSAQEAVRYGYSAYETLLGDVEPSVRIGACHLLTDLTEDRTVLLNLFTDAWQSEHDTGVRGAFLLAIGKLSDPDALEYPILETVLFSPFEPALLRFAAATQLTRLSPVLALGPATPVLAEAAVNPSALESDWSKIAPNAPDVATVATECLTML